MHDAKTKIELINFEYSTIPSFPSYKYTRMCIAQCVLRISLNCR